MKPETKTTPKKIAKFFSKLALKYATSNVNYSCLVFFHQPKTPKALDQYRKFK
ncbi:cyclic lactone autoinducer peptide [Ruminococcaceae bacterium OttesenSCG-928-A16]|nr:cyclic lactone autoinducer peptide [Ruminococcaceae bacterium OttesenSCG-928-A16]